MHEPATRTTKRDTGPLGLPMVVRTRARLLALMPMLLLAAVIGCITLSVATAVLAISGSDGAAVLCGIVACLFGIAAFGMYETTGRIFEAIVEGLDELEDTRAEEGAS
jgi:hypothetical protein